MLGTKENFDVEQILTNRDHRRLATALVDLAFFSAPPVFYVPENKNNRGFLNVWDVRN